MEAWCTLAGDPDGVLADWIRVGAPLGIEREVAPRGVFPLVEGPARTAADMVDVQSDPLGWTNYRSADDAPEAALPLLEAMVQKGWAATAGSWDELQELCGGPPTLNRLGLISKTRPGGAIKRRLVWDIRQ